ncbi:MAG TPA: FkbM family methyltransferase [Saprospiraceae bacterium]|nr:FkbM family methyltransferase [Saprospiraceae bacterium]
MMSFLDHLRLKARADKYRRRSDPGGIRFLLETLLPGQTALDIGAHKGGYAYWMLRQVGPQGKIFAFEPQQSLFGNLVKLKKNLHWDNCTVEHLALSDHAGSVELRIPVGKDKKSSPGASIVKTVFEEADIRTETVNMMTLDAYCKQHHIVPNLLKIDVEGNELAVLQGGEQVLRQHRPAILLECEARHVGAGQAEATFRFLENLGYQGFFIEGSLFRPLAEFDFSVHQAEGKKPYCNNFIFQ